MGEFEGNRVNGLEAEDSVSLAALASNVGDPAKSHRCRDTW